MRVLLPCLFGICLASTWTEASEPDLFIPVMPSSMADLSSVGTSEPLRLGSGGLNLVIQPGAGSALASNGPALAAFNRAAATWASYLQDDITIVIEANLVSFGTGHENVIGGATPIYLQGSYATVAGLLAGDAADESDDGIVSTLPSSLSIHSLTGVAFSGNVLLTKANAKALGLPASYLDSLVNTSIDARIEFNSDFAFSYDRGTAAPGTIDFESVALHEIGHALGFLSQTDVVDGFPIGSNLTGTTISVTTMDLFRFAATNKPVDGVGFTNGVRELAPGVAAGFSDGVDYYAMSTGAVRGDGRQASHWKDGSLPGNSLIGAMDPTLDYGQIFIPSLADLRVFDLIGYDIVTVPVPAAAFGLIGVLVFVSRRRRG